jgi:hypothetical protein
MNLFFFSPGRATESAGPPMVELPVAIHFIAPEGSDVSVTAGVYRVEQAAGTRLQLASDATQTTQEIPATSFTHEETLTAPLAFAVREKEQADAVHLLLLLPGGKGLDAAGRMGDVQTRGSDVRFRPRSRYTGIFMQQGRVQLDADMQSDTNRQTRAAMQRKIAEMEKQLKEHQRELKEAQDKSAFDDIGAFIMGADPGVATTGSPMALKRCNICKVLQKK